MTAVADAGSGGTTGATSAPRPTPVLELEDVDAGYGVFHALFGLSLHVDPGEAVALVGANGAGKTTVARVASGLLVPTLGRVKVDGVDLTDRPAQVFARAGVSHAPEGRSVFATLTVEENLSLPFRRAFGRDGEAPALERVFELFPRMGERRKQLAGSLSGGEQRMLTLGRALVLEPRILIADELSLGLAPVVIDQVYEVLAQVRDAGTALLIIEQHIDHALALADRVLACEHGQIVATGRPEDIDLSAVFAAKVVPPPAEELEP